ncbi:MAG TPA: hypothetical protein PKK67_01910 [Cyclobacteriaceae bacterium]|nr:hypothetical protein [Cyclobacteriaceae bacterium]
MKLTWKAFTIIITVLLLSSFSGCDPNIHKPSDHPCNFPDLDAEINPRSPQWYKIIDKVTSVNLVDITTDAIIHRDSVVLYDDHFEEIPPSNRYFIDNWVYTNLEPYKDVPFHDPQALLDLTERTFYLKTSYNDIDTIRIVYKQCLIHEIYFNGLDTRRPANDPHEGYTTFYFKK